MIHYPGVRKPSDLSIGERLLYIAGWEGLTVREFCIGADVTYNQLVEYVFEIEPIPTNVLVNIHRFWNTDLNWLLGGTESPCDEELHYCPKCTCDKCGPLVEGPFHEGDGMYFRPSDCAALLQLERMASAARTQLGGFGGWWAQDVVFPDAGFGSLYNLEVYDAEDD